MFRNLWSQFEPVHFDAWLDNVRALLSFVQSDAIIYQIVYTVKAGFTVLCTYRSFLDKFPRWGLSNSSLI